MASLTSMYKHTNTHLSQCTYFQSDWGHAYLAEGIVTQFTQGTSLPSFLLFLWPSVKQLLHCKKTTNLLWHLWGIYFILFYFSLEDGIGDISLCISLDISLHTHLQFMNGSGLRLVLSTGQTRLTRSSWFSKWHWYFSSAVDMLCSKKALSKTFPFLLM